MRQRKGILLFLLSGGMELCWLYAWAAFSMSLIMHRPFPFQGAICTFALAAIITRFSMGNGWRIIHLAGLQLLGFGCTALCIVYAVFYPVYPAFSTDWLITLFRSSRTLLEWVNLIFTFIWTVLFWIGGATLSKRRKTYFTFCSRFDIGIAAFFCLYLTKLVLLTKGGIKIDEHASPALIFPFFLFGLLAIGMTKAENKGSRDYLPGYHNIGIISSFAAAVVISAGSMILFFLPGMRAAAGIGYHAIKNGAYSTLPFVERALRFMFARRGPPRSEPSDSALGYALDSLSVKGSWWMDIVEKILGWGIKGIIAILLLVVLGILVFYTVRWFFSRTPLMQGDMDESWNGVPLFIRIWNALVSFCRRVLRSIKGYNRAAELYNALLYWGRYSGLSHVIHETPLEFGARLTSHFPHLKQEIQLIVNAFNNEVYGETSMSIEGLMQIRSAWYILRNPIHWPARMKVRFFGSAVKQVYAMKN